MSGNKENKKVKRWKIMAIVLTNGKFYIAHDDIGKIIKVHSRTEAQDFHSVERAVELKKNAVEKQRVIFQWILFSIRCGGKKYSMCLLTENIT